MARLPEGMLTDSWMYAHPDLYDGPRYPVDSLGVCDGKPDGNLANVAEVNAACGSSSAVRLFQSRIGAHEDRHKRSYNECVTSGSRLQGLVGKLDALVSRNAVSDAKRLLEDMKWVLYDAAESGLGPETSPPGFWHWRELGVWRDVPITTKGHGGQWACP